MRVGERTCETSAHASIRTSSFSNEQVAYILTDAAAYRQNNRILIGLTPKVWTLPHANAAFCGRGPLPAVKYFGDMLQFCSSFDEMRVVPERKFTNGLAAKFHRSSVTARTLFGLEPWPPSNKAASSDVEINLVGYSAKAKKMVLLYGATCGPQAFELHSAPILIGPPLSAEETDAIRWPDDHQASRDPLVWGKLLLSIMKRQREVSLARRDGEVIGGVAVLTTILPHGISQQILHRWDDKVGDMIF